jgi:hypothetical protein
MMVPFADFINHANVDSSYEIVHRDVNPAQKDCASLPKAYFTVSKSEVNYSELYEQNSTEANNSSGESSNQEEVPVVPTNPTQEDPFSELAKIENNKSINRMKLVDARNQVLQAQNTVQLLNQMTAMNVWELDYLSSTDEEDGDSSEEESGSDSQEEVYENKQRKKTKKVIDIVDTLIQKQEQLQKRDIEARTRKLKMRH